MTAVKIHGLDVRGDGVGRLSDGEVVFVPGTFPGDHVRVRLTERVKKVQRAELLEILDASEMRTVSRCGIEDCGGCALRGLNNEGHASTKRDKVVNALERIGKIEGAADAVGRLHQVGDGWAYRHRARLHAHHDGTRWLLGFYARGSHRVIPFTQCPVLWPELEQHIQQLLKAVAGLSPRAKIRELEVAYSRRDGRCATKIQAGGDIEFLRDPAQWIENSGMSGVEVQCPDARFRWGNLELRYDHHAVDNFDLRYEPGVFTQAHPEANDALVEAVMTSIRPNDQPLVWELHAGIGNFSIALALAGAQVRAVEIHPRAVVMANRNARAAGASVDLIESSDKSAIAELAETGPSPDVLVLDPPRVGAKEAVEALAESDIRPPKIVYVSCDPATLARDLSRLVDVGYQLGSVRLFDFFPQTMHVESLAILSI